MTHPHLTPHIPPTQVLALPSVAGDVHDVIVMDDILCFASGPACWMYGNGGDGFSWREQPDYYVAAYLIHPLVERCQLVERCLEPMLIAHPEIVNCKHPKTGETFLQYAVKTTTHPHVMRLLLEGNFETKIGLLRDNFDRTALHVALELGRRSWVKLIVSGIINGRVLNLPSALLPVVECFPALARAHPKQFIRLVCDMPLVRQHEDCSPNYADSPHTMETMGSHDARLFIQWSSPRGWAVAAIASLRCLFLCCGVEGSASQYVRGRNNRRQSSIFSASIQGTTTNALSVSASTSATRRTDDRPVGLMALPSRWFGKGRARSGFNTTMRRPSFDALFSTRKGSAGGGGGARSSDDDESEPHMPLPTSCSTLGDSAKLSCGDATPRHTHMPTIASAGESQLGCHRSSATEESLSRRGSTSGRGSGGLVEGSDVGAAVSDSALGGGVEGSIAAERRSGDALSAEGTPLEHAVMKRRLSGQMQEEDLEEATIQRMGGSAAALRDRSAGLAQPSRRVRATLNVFAGRKDNGRDTFGSGRLFGRDTTIDPSGSGSRMTDYEASATPTNPAKHRARKSFLPKKARFGTFRHGSSMQASGGLPNVQRRSIAQPLGADDTIEPLSRKSEAVVCTVPWQGWAGLPESGVQEDSPLFLVVEAAQVTGDRSIFSSRAVLAMLQFKWKKFARGWYYLNLLLYVGFLVIISHHVTMLTKVHVLKLDRDGKHAVGFTEGRDGFMVSEELRRFAWTAPPECSDAFGAWNVSAASWGDSWAPMVACEPTLQWTLCSPSCAG